MPYMSKQINFLVDTHKVAPDWRERLVTHCYHTDTVCEVKPTVSSKFNVRYYTVTIYSETPVPFIETVKTIKAKLSEEE